MSERKSIPFSMNWLPRLPKLIKSVVVVLTKFGHTVASVVLVMNM